MAYCRTVAFVRLCSHDSTTHCRARCTKQTDNSPAGTSLDFTSLDFVSGASPLQPCSRVAFASLCVWICVCLCGCTYVRTFADLGPAIHVPSPCMRSTPHSHPSSGLLTSAAGLRRLSEEIHQHPLSASLEAERGFPYRSHLSAVRCSLLRSVNSLPRSPLSPAGEATVPLLIMW